MRLLGEKSEASSAALAQGEPSHLKRCPPFTAKAPLPLALTSLAKGGYRFSRKDAPFPRMVHFVPMGVSAGWYARLSPSPWQNNRM